MNQNSFSNVLGTSRLTRRIGPDFFVWDLASQNGHYYFAQYDYQA